MSNETLYASTITSNKVILLSTMWDTNIANHIANLVRGQYLDNTKNSYNSAIERDHLKAG